MMERISDRIAAMVKQAIADLEILEEARREITWEVMPALIPVPAANGLSLGFMVAVCVPVRNLAGDHVLHMAPLEDPGAPQEEVSRLVRSLHASAQEEADKTRMKEASLGNGNKRSDGGLIMP